MKISTNKPKKEVAKKEFVFEINDEDNEHEEDDDEGTEDDDEEDDDDVYEECRLE